MDIREHDSFPRMPEASAYALGIVTAIVILTGFAMAAAWFALLILDEERTAPMARAANATCGICGVVEVVRELDPAPAQALEGGRAEGAITLLAALSGARPGVRPARIYETSVVHDDGSMRVLRETSVPQWKPGDRVRVIKGQVEPVASPAGRIPSPGPQVTQGW